MVSAIGSRHPASASCLGRHLRLAGLRPINSSLFLPQGLLLLRKRGFSRFSFSPWGTLSVISLCSMPAPPKGELFGICRSALMKLPLRGSWHAAGVTERVLPASTSLSSTTPAYENGVQKHPQAFLDPKIKNIISLAYAQSNAERIQNRPTQQEPAVCFTPSSVQSPQGLLPPRRR